MEVLLVQDTGEHSDIWEMGDVGLKYGNTGNEGRQTPSPPRYRTGVKKQRPPSPIIVLLLGSKAVAMFFTFSVTASLHVYD